MNLGFVKLVLWIGSIALFGGLAHSLFQFKQDRDQGVRRSANMTQELLTKVLDQKAPDEKELPELPYDPVKMAFHTMLWTGKPEEVKAPDVEVPKPVVAKTPEPVARLLQILFIQQDTSDPARSLTMVKYIGKLAGYQSRQQADSHSLRVGDVLPEDFDYWRVLAIDASGVTFTCTRPDDFDSKKVKDQVVTKPEPIKGDIPLIGGESGVSEIRDPFPEAGKADRDRVLASWPMRTQQVRNGYARVGTEDALRIENDYLDILSTEVRHRSHINPRTGEFDGIEIMEIAPGSIAADFGARAGDIIKSINGHAVTTVNEAITFAKNNADYYSVWEVVVENAGKERTLTIETPPK